MGVRELSRDQFEELKFDYYCELFDEKSELLDGITCSDEIPDEMVYKHFDGVQFVPDDFCCSCGQD